MDEKKLFCTKCKNPRDKGRTLCRECFLKDKREKQKKIFNENGRYNYGIGNCIRCGKEITLWRKDQNFCKECVNYKTRDNDNTHNISWLYRKKIKQVFGLELSYNDVVHHLDENPSNNTIDNLIIISRQCHGKLHSYLKVQRAILEKSNNGISVNCWNNLRVPMTTAWLETTNAKVIKLSEIGQSAAKPLTSLFDEYGEGSETIHGTPDHLVEGEDIVQTTTE